MTENRPEHTIFPVIRDTGDCGDRECCGAPGGTPESSDEVCCGGPPPKPSDPFERPGYRLRRFVDTFLSTPAGAVPRIRTRPGIRDVLGAVRVRLGISRNDYRVAPGLYGVGQPHEASPVLVTANFKLTFDILRKALDARSLWLLVLDTRGINVWCAAGKGTFSSGEVVRRVAETRLAAVVRHRRLILPQLSATGVSARDVRKGCGFEVIWGPVRADDIGRFLDLGLTADTPMRQVTFTLVERLLLVPVELSHLPKPTCWILLASVVLSGIGPEVFSLDRGVERGVLVAAAYLAGVLSGAVLVPALLPVLPGRAFSVKGAFAGAVAGAAVLFGFTSGIGLWAAAALLLCTVTVSSYLAMNFTGATPFTSPSGVEREMRLAIPLQAATALIAVAVWIATGFAA